MVLLFVPALARAQQAPAAAPRTCTYDVYNWNIYQKRAVNQGRVAHPYAELTSDEKDPGTGCTVCLEDQEELKVGNLPPFLACRRIAPALKAALEKLAAAGQPLLEVTAYRPGKTKNPLDKKGNRTGFSNHAYGAAVDINRSKNGLYDKCFKFGPGCRLIQGGPWRPGATGTLTKDSPIVSALREAGFKWGGEIEGQQKDFMHFSPSGY
jgi:hypothetical protein